MNRLSIIRIEANNLNGFIFEILDIEYKSFEGALFGISCGETFLNIEVLFITFEVKIHW